MTKPTMPTPDTTVYGKDRFTAPKHAYFHENVLALNKAWATYHEAAIKAAVEALRVVTPEMVKAYLDANTEYWRMQDALPAPVGKWRNGTPNEATEYALTKMFAAHD